MKHLLLYFFICFTSCVVAQSFTQTFVASNEYGISSFSDNFTEPKVEIFPNPTADIITIKDKEGVVAVATIFNLLGKEVAKIPVNGISTYDMMDHHKGIYLVQLKDNQGKILQTVRIKKI